mgnify:CR=1 FL=1
MTDETKLIKGSGGGPPAPPPPPRTKTPFNVFRQLWQSCREHNLLISVYIELTYKATRFRLDGW